MRLALELAARGVGQTSPNPQVGAVVVRDGQVVGQGFHVYREIRHGEVKALDEAGNAAQGATLCLNLEPCCHQGRTPPCVDRIVRSGVRRVVAGTLDPNPLVNGKGFALLRQAGIEVVEGVLEAEARRVNEAYLKFARLRLPFVTLKAGMSLDGKIATQAGESRWITSPEARQYGQRLRLENDAILVGVETVAKDNPQLTYRGAQPKGRPLVRVILDSQLRIPTESNVLTAGEGGGPTLIFTTGRSDVRKRQFIQEQGGEVVLAPEKDGWVDLQFVVEELGRRQILSLLIEGGSQVNWSALEAGGVDKVVFLVAPKILGGTNSIPVVGGKGVARLEESFPLYSLRSFPVGPDIALEGYLHPDPPAG